MDVKWVIGLVVLIICAFIPVIFGKGTKQSQYEELQSIAANNIESGEQESYHVESHNQTGGVTAGRIEKINILTDKESLGIREEFGLYKQGKKVGEVRNPVINKERSIITFDEIQLDKPIKGTDFIFQEPFEFRNYIIQIEQVRDVDNAAIAPVITDVEGIILIQ